MLIMKEERERRRKDGLPAGTPRSKKRFTEDHPLKTGSSKAGSGTSSEEGGQAVRE